jgi:DNA polymerase I-like protein with 3'-5' exonuclease and polymerase domains
MALAASVGYFSSIGALEQVAARVIADGQPISLDIETGYEGEARQYKNVGPSLHPEENVLAGVSFTNNPDWARYAPLNHDEGPNLDNRAAARILWDVCATGRAVTHGGDLDARTLSRWFMRWIGDDPDRRDAVRASNGYFPVMNDTLIMCHSLALWESLKLKVLSREVFGHDQAELTSLFPGLPKNKEHTLRFTVLDPCRPEVYSYACDDVIQTLRLHRQYYDAVLMSGQSFIYHVEMACLPVVWAMEDEGIAVDWDMLDRGTTQARMAMSRLQSAIDRALSQRLERAVTLNMGSTKQLREVLYAPAPRGLGLKQYRMTKGGKDGLNKQQSTDALALKALISDPAVRKILDWRAVDKLRGTYLETFRQEYGWCECGRAHCHLLPHGTVTGRFSSTDFNYQNLPKKTRIEITEDDEFTYNFRNAIITPHGYYGMGFDLSQAELRVVAGEAGETALLEAFARGDDVHALTASLLLGIELAEVYQGGELFGRQLDSFRPIGKTLNFALIYQLSVKGLADRLGIAVEHAQELYDRYFSIYPMIAAYTRRVVSDARVNGYTLSSLGRRHPIWAFKSDKSSVIAGGERTAGNAPVQGGVADLMKLIMVRCAKVIAAASMTAKIRMVMNIHDALEFYVAEDVLPQQVIDLLTPAIMVSLPQTAHWPPMAADWHVWERWGSAVELKLDDSGHIIGAGDVVEVAADVADEDADETADWDAWAEGPVAAAPAGDDSTTGNGRGGGDRRVRPADGGAGTVVIRLAEMPELSAVQLLAGLLAEWPGSNPVAVETPEGRVSVGPGTSLTPDDGAMISLTVPGAVVVWDAASVPADRVTAGTSL